MISSKELGLVGFDGEVVVCLPVVDQVGGELALGQQRIGGNLLALDIDGVEQRGGHFDFVGAFEFIIAFYRQSTDFFLGVTGSGFGGRRR